MEQTFENLQINKSLIEAMKLADITKPTEIQQMAIPAAQKNLDIIFQSETGTGKTLAYLLPLFEKLDTGKKEMQALVLVPTHELAIQVIRVIEMLSLNSDLKATSTPVIGDVNITRQVDKLRTKPHIIVGTAGRILELIQKKKISAHTIKTIIIDEADRLLDDSNQEAIKAVIKTTLKERQIIMCSASIPARTIERAKPLMKEPHIIKSKTAVEVPDTIDHLYFVAEEREKIEVLRKLVRIINPPKAIAFFGNAGDILEATEKLKYHKLRADGLHGSNIKSDRKKTMDDFKSGRLQLLIASDVAARGLDIEGVTHIFNINIPERSMEYLHRAGRTGRNGSAGTTISIVSEKELPLVKQFEKELRISIIPKSMYNGVIVEYRKENKKFDTTSEYTPPKYRKNGKTENTEDRNEMDKALKDGPGERSLKRNSREGRPDRKYKAQGNRPYDKDKSEFRTDKEGIREGNGKREKRFAGNGDKPQYRGNKSTADGKQYERDGRPSDKKFSDKQPGDKKFGDKKFGDKKFGDKKFGDKKFGDKKFGDKKFGDKKFGDKKFGDKKFGDKKFGDKKFGDKKFGDKKFGDKKFGDEKPGDKKFGDKKFGDKKFGDKKFGDKKFGDKKFGDKKFGRTETSGKKSEQEGNKETFQGNGGKQIKIKFADKPPKNLKPWDRKPQSGQRKSKK
ncbi:DEAD-box ATP-dependent RNA helicase CshA [Ruminiclostridium hungatei]|uniref:DEAD-box ATP-dependent RNA helicase CshA n=1 Tax=Ruminiclostridium hungatei TaxID=48256 RepID=A0A1V4SP51_RUMHU|nr:DEAD-box ATP-dependent RNA helicase CshA [Ruminiclostridium hungatei]